MSGSYYVYMTTDRHHSTLYTGMTNDLERRVSEHKARAIPGFTSRYHADKLVYFDETNDVLAAISREKEIKGWTRAKKIALIESANPGWADLSEGWVEPDLYVEDRIQQEGAGVLQNDGRRVQE